MVMVKVSVIRRVMPRFPVRTLTATVIMLMTSESTCVVCILRRGAVPRFPTMLI